MTERAATLSLPQSRSACPGPVHAQTMPTLPPFRCVGSFIGRCGLINAEGVRHHPAWMQVPPDESLEEL